MIIKSMFMSLLLLTSVVYPKGSFGSKEAAIEMDIQNAEKSLEDLEDLLAKPAKDANCKANAKDTSKAMPKDGAILMVEDMAELNNHLSSTKTPVVIKFFAPWCGPCKMVGPQLEELAKDRKDLKFIQVSVEGKKDSKALFEKHGVKSFPTMVVFNNNKEIGRFSGYKDKAGLGQEIDKILKTPTTSKKPAAPKMEQPQQPAPSKEEMTMQEFMAALMGGDLASAKKLLNKDSINYVIPTPQADLSLLLLIALTEIEGKEELINHALSLKPDLKKVLNLNGQKKTISGHLLDMSTTLRKQAETFEKLSKKLS